MGKTVIKIDNHAEDIGLLMNELANVAIKGVIHLGAHKGEEVEEYFRRGFSEIILIEANPELYQYLFDRFAGDKRVKVYNYAISDTIGWVDFYIHQSSRGNLEPSSILKMKKFKDIVKTLSTTATIKVRCITLSEFVKVENIDIDNYNLLILDIQGAEYMALKGAFEILNRFSIIISEVVKIELYEGIALEEEVDKLLEQAGFRRKFTIYHELYDETGRFPAWGEAIFQNNLLV